MLLAFNDVAEAEQVEEAKQKKATEAGKPQEPATPEYAAGLQPLTPQTKVKKHLWKKHSVWVLSILGDVSFHRVWFLSLKFVHGNSWIWMQIKQHLFFLREWHMIYDYISQAKM